jgi:malonyl-CoA decarboxylase
MKRFRLERFLERIADRGRDLLHLRADAVRRSDMRTLCRALLSGKGEASGTALSREVLRAYEAMDRVGRHAFFELLAREFGPDPQAVRTAANEYLHTGAAEALEWLGAVAEPPRQELFRRINMAPRGTAALVAMRAELLDCMRENAALRVVDADLTHLLSSWFNRGFLRLERIDWHSPADLLERLIRYDRVQAVTGWDDMHRRLAADRRCFAFFHPALPEEPLIFVEVALVRRIACEARSLLDQNAPVLDPDAAHTAMFYSINSTQRGLGGLSFGNFLIKQVLEALQEELPRLKVFATLSPLPGFAATLKAAARNEAGYLTRTRLETLLADFREPLRHASHIDRPVDALFALLEHVDRAPPEVLTAPLERLALAYVGLVSRDRRSLDAVANFHLSNGARLERINPFADLSSARIEASYGVMVNYRYEPDEVVANHEGFVSSGKIAMSASLSRALQKIEHRWASDSAAA